MQVAQRISSRLDLSSSSPSSSSVEEGRAKSNPQDLEDAAAEQQLEADITALLRQMGEVNDDMGKVVESSGRGHGSAAVLVRRMREILYDYREDFRKANELLRKARARTELFNSASSVDVSNGNDAEMDHLLRERGALNSSLLSSRSILGQASEIISDLRNQRTTMSGASSRVVSLAGNVPGINEVIDKIRRKKNKDNAVMGLIIAFCVLFCLWYVFG